MGTHATHVPQPSLTRERERHLPPTLDPPKGTTPGEMEKSVRGRPRVMVSVCDVQSADVLVAVVLLGEGDQGRLDDSATETQHQVKRRLLLDVVVRQRSPVLELLSGENQTLLIRRDAWT